MLTVFEYALYSYARRRMTADEVKRAQYLADRVERLKDPEARALLKELALTVIHRPQHSAATTTR